MFVVEVHAPASASPDSAEFRQRDTYLGQMELAIHTQQRPVLVPTRGTDVGRLSPNAYYGDDNLFATPTTVADLDDAVIFLGRDPQFGRRIR
jgi:hypothetical protein